MDSLPAQLLGKPKNTGVGSLSLLQGNLPDPGIEPGSPVLQDSLPVELPRKSFGNQVTSCFKIQPEQDWIKGHIIQEMLVYNDPH